MSEYYGTSARADAYHLARGNAAWAALTSEQKTAALYRGSLAVDAIGNKVPEIGQCVLAFPGVKTGGRSQLLQWPRTDALDTSGDAIDPDAVPTEVEYSTYEAALIEAATPNSLMPVVTAAKALKRRKLGELEQEFAVSDSSSAVQDATPVLTSVMALLGPVLIRRCAFGGIAVV